MRTAVTDFCAAEPRREWRLKMDRPRHLEGCAERGAERLDGGRIVETEENERARPLGARQYLEGDARHDGERAPASTHRTAEIIARHVLHDAPATAKSLSRAGDRLDAEQVIARAPSHDAAAPRQIRREDRADRATARWSAEHRAEIDRLEGEHLALVGKALLDIGERRAGACAHDEFGRLIERDTAERGRSDGKASVDRASDIALRAGPEDLDGHLGARCVHYQALELALAPGAGILLHV
jgi:hypothetical protein